MTRLWAATLVVVAFHVLPSGALAQDQTALGTGAKSDAELLLGFKATFVKCVQF